MSGIPPNESPDLQQRILRVALEAFAERGYSSTSMRLVAERAGCTKPALYYHFGSKEELFRAVVDACERDIAPAFEHALERATTTRERIEAFATALYSSVESDPVAMQLMLSLQSRPDQAQPDVDMAAKLERGVTLVAGLLAPGVEAGEVRDDVDLREAADLILTVLHARIYLATKGIPMPPDSPRRITDLLFRGLSPR